MPQNLGLIHPAMFPALIPAFYPSLITIQRATVTQSPTGAPIHGWANVSGMVLLPCRSAAAGGAEAKSQEQVVVQSVQTAVIPMDLVGISELDRVILDGEIMDIVSVDYDSQQQGGGRQSTRLSLKVVS